jgi:hypothetical protein
VTGRIIIDALGFGKFNPDFEIYVEAIKPEESDEPQGTVRPSSSSNGDREKHRPTPEEQRSNKNEIQSRRQRLLLMSPMLAGYSLKLKKWRKYFSRCSWRSC